jgi:PleD family two-component response regulator
MKSVLVVDADKMAAKEICSHLSSYKTYQAVTGQAALEMAIAETPDLILLNPFMPGMAGFSLLYMLQQHPQLCYIPVILLSPDNSPDFQARGLQSGVVDFIQRESDCEPVQILDWEILKIRLDIHLRPGEYRLPLEHSVNEPEAFEAVQGQTEVICA